jgi:hypothetical protein
VEDRREAGHRRDVFRVERERALEQLDAVVVSFLVIHAVEKRPAPHHEIGSVGIVWPLAHRPQGLRFDEFGAQRVGEARDKLDLQLAEAGALALEPVGPDMRAGFSRNKRRVDRDLVARPPHAAFEHIAYAEFTADRFRVDRLALVSESRLAGDDAVRQVREVGGQIVSDPVSEITLLRIAAEILERQHDDRKPRRRPELVLSDR